MQNQDTNPQSTNNMTDQNLPEFDDQPWDEFIGNTTQPPLGTTVMAPNTGYVQSDGSGQAAVTTGANNNTDPVAVDNSLFDYSILEDPDKLLPLVPLPSQNPAPGTNIQNTQVPQLMPNPTSNFGGQF